MTDTIKFKVVNIYTAKARLNCLPGIIKISEDGLLRLSVEYDPSKILPKLIVKAGRPNRNKNTKYRAR